MKTYVVYDDTGRINSTLTVSERQQVPSNAIEVEQEGTLDVDYYVDTDTLQLIERLPLGLTHTVSGLSLEINSAPAGACFYVLDKSAVSDGGSFEVEFDTPGTYEIYIDPPPQYKAETLEVTVG